MIVKMHEAKTKLSELVERAMGGEEVIIARNDVPKVRLVPIDQPKRPRFGHWAGLLPPKDLEDFRPMTDAELIAEGFELCVPDQP